MLGIKSRIAHPVISVVTGNSYIRTNASVWLSQPWKANSFPASQDIHRAVCTLDYRVHKNRPFVPVLSQRSSVHTIPTDLFKYPSSYLSSHQRLVLPSGLFPSSFPHQNSACPSSLPRSFPTPRKQISDNNEIQDFVNTFLFVLTYFI